MYSKASVAALCGALVAVSAQTTTPSSAAAKATGPVVTVLFPGADEQPLVGSIIAVQSALTTLNVECAAGVDSDDCGVPMGGIKVTKGPSTAIMSTVIPSESDPIVVSYGWECSIGGTTTAECVYSNVVSVTGTPSPSLLSSINEEMSENEKRTIELNQRMLSSAMFGVTITAGADKLSQTGSAEPTGSQTGSAKASGSGTESATGSQTGTPTGSGSGAGPKETGAASSVKMGGFAIGGAIAALFML